MTAALIHAILDFLYAGTETGEISAWSHTMDTTTLRTAESSNVDPFGETRKVGQDKTMFPQFALDSEGNGLDQGQG